MNNELSVLPVIALIDMDCFFVQVEQRTKPELAGKPCAVTQYNLYKQGGIIAVNYEARALGIKKGIRGEDALKKCKNLTLFHTPQRRGKADSSKYREASFEVFDVLKNFDSNLIVEKASIDEAYIDLTDYINKNIIELSSIKEKIIDTYVEDSNTIEKNDINKFYNKIIMNCEEFRDEINLLKGAHVVSILRKMILEKTGFYCSAGISHSKVLAKLAAGLHKPKSQTILPNCGKKQILARTRVDKLRSLGGKFGLQVMERLNIEFVDEINNFTIEQLALFFNFKTAEYLLKLANGFDDDKVVPRVLSKSIGCAKNFSGIGESCLVDQNQVQHWINQLVDELLERLERDRQMNNRQPTLLVVGFDQQNIGMLSRSIRFEIFNKKKIVNDIMTRILVPIIFQKKKEKNSIRFLSVAATKFIGLVDEKNRIENFFKKKKKSLSTTDGDDSESKIGFKNLNCKKMMDEYFSELESDINRPRKSIKPKLTILNMFNKMAEKRDENYILNDNNNNNNNNNNQATTNTSNNCLVRSVETKLIKSNPIIDLIEKKNKKIDQDTISSSLQKSEKNKQSELFVRNQIELIKKQNLLNECEFKKLEKELISELQTIKSEKIGFFKRKSIELELARKNKQ